MSSLHQNSIIISEVQSVILSIKPMMENQSLLCDEVWPIEEDDGCNSCLEVEDDCGQEAFALFVNKEERCKPHPSYLNLLNTNPFILHSRSNSILWLIKSQKMHTLSIDTLGIAVNYFDRFVSLARCYGWKCWTFELLSVACLSIATKFNETATLPLTEFQMEESVDHYFDPTLIQRMELTVLEGLGWRMDSTTPFSYIDLLVQNIDSYCLNKTLVGEFTARVHDMLLSSLLDHKFLEFQPYIIAISAVRCVFGDLFPSKDIRFVNNTLSKHAKDDVMSKCQERFVHFNSTRHCSTGGPSSPVTVLKEEPHCCSLDLCAISIEFRWSGKKRKREDMGC